MISILRKELRSRMRGWRSPAIVMLYLAIVALVSYAVLENGLNTQSFSANQASSLGLNLFNTLAIFQGFLIMFITPAATAGAICGERQRQTLDLLLVTKLSSLGIASGKLLAAIAFDLLLILCAMPIFSLVFLFGGIGLDTVLELILLYVLSIICFGSIGLAVSALAKKIGRGDGVDVPLRAHSRGRTGLSHHLPLRSRVREQHQRVHRTGHRIPRSRPRSGSSALPSGLLFRGPAAVCRLGDIAADGSRDHRDLHVHQHACPSAPDGLSRDTPA